VTVGEENKKGEGKRDFFFPFSPALDEY